MLWLDLHLETYQHEPAVCPGIKREGKEMKWYLAVMNYSMVFDDRECLATYLLMLLEQVVQVVASLVIKIEVLALCLAFGTHHFGDGCPVSPVLD